MPVGQMTCTLITSGTQQMARLSKPDGRRFACYRRAGCFGVPIVALIVLGFLFDWNWLRHPVENYCARNTHRDCQIGHLSVQLGRTPTVVLRDVTLANAPWSNDAPMAKAGVVEFTIGLVDGNIVIPRVSLSDADLHFERLADGRTNWAFSDSPDGQSQHVRIRHLALKGSVTYVDHSVPLRLNVDVSDRGGSSDEPEFTTRYRFEGKYHAGTFSGDALWKDVGSFRDSGHETLGTRYDVEQ